MSNMTLIVLIVLALVIIWMVTNFIINKRSVTELNQEEF
ncbi:rhodanese-like domain-containing protein, partial [Staphylococcus pseudintermedius]